MGNGRSSFFTQNDIKEQILKKTPKRVKFKQDQITQSPEHGRHEHEGMDSDVNDEQWRNEIVLNIDENQITGFYLDEDVLDKHKDDECYKEDIRQIFISPQQHEPEAIVDLNVKICETTPDQNVDGLFKQQETNHQNLSFDDSQPYHKVKTDSGDTNISSPQSDLNSSTTELTDTPQFLKPSECLNLHQTYPFLSVHKCLLSSSTEVISSKPVTENQFTANTLISPSILQTPANKSQSNPRSIIKMSDVHDKYLYSKVITLLDNVQNNSNAFQRDESVQCGICCKNSIEILEPSKILHHSEEDKPDSSEIYKNKNSCGVNGLAVKKWHKYDKVMKLSHKIPILSVNSKEIIDFTEDDTTICSETTLCEENSPSLNYSLSSWSMKDRSKEKPCTEVSDSDIILQVENQTIRRCDRTNQIKPNDTTLKMEYQDDNVFAPQDVISRSEEPDSIDITKEGHICTPTVTEKIHCPITNQVESTYSPSTCEIEKESVSLPELGLLEQNLAKSNGQEKTKAEEKGEETSHYPKTLTMDTGCFKQYNLSEMNDITQKFNPNRPQYVQLVGSLAYCLDRQPEKLDTGDAGYLNILKPLAYVTGATKITSQNSFRNQGLKADGNKLQEHVPREIENHIQTGKKSSTDDYEIEIR
ncbi:unnamed protein product [Heterobilharzia americana]|nr:unnamed protein product [Heterobilharzia americana]CAH8615348.1 unnamed protein product [Heterobilharzia americana]